MWHPVDAEFCGALAQLQKTAMPDSKERTCWKTAMGRDGEGRDMAKNNTANFAAIWMTGEHPYVSFFVKERSHGMSPILQKQKKEGNQDCSKKDNIKCYSLCKAYKDKVGVRGEIRGGMMVGAKAIASWWKLPRTKIIWSTWLKHAETNTASMTSSFSTDSNIETSHRNIEIM